MNFKAGLKIFLDNFLDLIYKRKCINCNCSIQTGILCKTCAKDVQFLSPFAHGIINGYKVYSAFYYEGAVKKIIHSLKFKHNKTCADISAEYLFQYLKTIKDINLKNAVIIPVLTHKKNYRIRGYDNVLEIAEKLSVLGGFDLDKSSLKRIKYTKPQYELNKNQRRKNVEGAFELDENLKSEKSVILLDDIITTGSTLDVITSLFKKQGIKNLICLTLSKTKI